MGYPVARLGDSSSHGGAIITSASNTTCEGHLYARVGDTLLCPIHGANPIVTGSPGFTVEGAHVARGNGGAGSVTACGAIIIGGAVKTVCG